MRRRQFIHYSGYLIVNTAMMPLVASARGTTVATYAVGPSIQVLPLEVADCDVLDEQLRTIERSKALLKENWTDSARKYRRRVQMEFARLQNVLEKENRTESTAERSKYIQATVVATGLLIAGIGVAVGGPIAIGTALGFQVLLGPTKLVLQAAFNTSTDEISLAKIIVEDRAFLIGGLAAGNSSRPIGRILGRSMTAVQLALDGWQLSHAVHEHREAVERARAAREDLKQIEKVLIMIDEQPRAWASMYLQHLTHTELALRDYIAETRETNCQVPAVRNMETLIRRP